MNRRVAWLAAIVLIGAAAGTGTGARARAATKPATLATADAVSTQIDGLFFDAKLEALSTASATASSGIFACPTNAITAEMLQFGFTQKGTEAQVSLAPSNLSSPRQAGLATASLAADGADWTFQDLPLPLGSGISIQARGRLAFGQVDDAGRPHTLTITDMHATGQVLTGDVVMSCDLGLRGTGILDQTPPSALFALDCIDPVSRSSTPCRLLNDATITIWFSEPVGAANAAALIEAFDSDLTAVPLTTAPGTGENAYTVSVRGFWPLGGSVTIRVRQGLVDRAGNRSPRTFEQAFRVVNDPGSLDNAGFETGDLSGFTVSVLREHLQRPASGFDAALFLAESPSASTPAAQVSDSLSGILPTEGRYMALLGAAAGCRSGEIALTARFPVPDRAVSLVLDYDFIGALTSSGAGGQEADTMPLVIATVQSRLQSQSMAATRPSVQNRQGSGGTVLDTGWRSLSVPVQAFSGKEVVLTIHARPEFVIGPPPLCTPGRLLLDNLRFE